MIESSPSFSIYNNNPGDGVEEEEIGNKIDETIRGFGGDDFSFSKPNMDLINEEGDELEEGGEKLGEVIVGLEKLGTEEVMRPPSPPMYLATGLGIRDGADNFEDVGEKSEDYYRELLEEYPNHPLVLRNFAYFLQRKGDLQAAEDYYFRATLADPGDGEVMSQYANLAWELHGDRERALIYFERAAQTAPENSNVMAAYAKFLWELDDDGQDESLNPNYVQEDILVGVDGNIHAAFESGCPDESGEVEKYFKRMIEENPSHPIFLKNYAQFLYQSKGDLEGAEEYYSRAIVCDPQDGEILSQYAKLIWELYHDQDRTLSYFERAVQASPEDSNVLAAYASFLWTIDDD